MESRKSPIAEARERVACGEIVHGWPGQIAHERQKRQQEALAQATAAPVRQSLSIPSLQREQGLPRQRAKPDLDDDPPEITPGGVLGCIVLCIIGLGALGGGEGAHAVPAPVSAPAVVRIEPRAPVAKPVSVAVVPEAGPDDDLPVAEAAPVIVEPAAQEMIDEDPADPAQDEGEPVLPVVDAREEDEVSPVVSPALRLQEEQQYAGG